MGEDGTIEDRASFVAGWAAGQATAEASPAEDAEASAEPERGQEGSAAAPEEARSAQANGDAPQAEASSQAEPPAGEGEQVGAGDSAEATVEPTRD